LKQLVPDFAFLHAQSFFSSILKAIFGNAVFGVDESDNNLGGAGRFTGEID
jgi:hypothetical protein